MNIGKPVAYNLRVFSFQSPEDAPLLMDINHHILAEPLPAPPAEPKEEWELALDLIRSDLEKVTGHQETRPSFFLALNKISTEIYLTMRGCSSTSSAH